MPSLARPAWLWMPRGSLRDPRLRASAAMTALVVVVALALAVSGPLRRAGVLVPPSPTAISEPSPGTSPEPGAAVVSPAPTVAGDEALGTAQPVETSAAVPSAPPPATPTPTPDPKVWRFEGRVVDESGAALEDVCVVIGPHGCREHGPHTDERGLYYIDMPQVPTVVYELRFQKEGYATVYYRAQPTGPQTFDVVLRRI